MGRRREDGVVPANKLGRSTGWAAAGTGDLDGDCGGARGQLVARELGAVVSAVELFVDESPGRAAGTAVAAAMVGSHCCDQARVRGAANKAAATHGSGVALHRVSPLPTLLAGRVGSARPVSAGDYCRAGRNLHSFLLDGCSEVPSFTSCVAGWHGCRAQRVPNSPVQP